MYSGHPASRAFLGVLLIAAGAHQPKRRRLASKAKKRKGRRKRKALGSSVRTGNVVPLRPRKSG